MLRGQPILPQEVLIVGHKKERPRAPINLWIRSVSAKAALPLQFTNLAETG